MANSPRESISSPRAHQRLSSLVKGASSAPTSPGQPSKPDRTADFAAVRNLAESYGVDLLPLEMGFTPLRTQARAADKAAQRLSTADSATDLPNTPEVGENAAAAAANRGLAQAYSDGSASGHEAGTAARVMSPRTRPQSPRKAPAAGPAVTDGAQDAVRQAAPAALGCFPIEVDGSEANTDSPYAEADVLDGEVEGEGSILYLDEEQLPVEERVTLLEVRPATASARAVVVFNRFGPAVLTQQLHGILSWCRLQRVLCCLYCSRAVRCAACRPMSVLVRLVEEYYCTNVHTLYWGSRPMQVPPTRAPWLLLLIVGPAGGA